MPSCRISCFRSELGERDRLQEVIAENERLRAALSDTLALGSMFASHVSKKLLVDYIKETREARELVAMVSEQKADKA